MDVLQERARLLMNLTGQLDSSDVEDRRWACAAVTNLITNDASTRRLLQAKGVVDKLITRLSDTEEDVVAEAVGSLR